MTVAVKFKRSSAAVPSKSRTRTKVSQTKKTTKPNQKTKQSNPIMLLNKLFGKKNKSSSHKNSDHNDDDDGENVQISSPVQVINHNSSSSQSSSTLMGKQQQQQLDFCTLAIHADRQVEKHVSDIAPPLHFSTTYDLDPELRSRVRSSSYVILVFCWFLSHIHLLCFPTSNNNE